MSKFFQKFFSLNRGDFIYGGQYIGNKKTPPINDEGFLITDPKILSSQSF